MHGLIIVIMRGERCLYVNIGYVGVLHPETVDCLHGQAGPSVHTNAVVFKVEQERRFNMNAVEENVGH